eukprot:2355230-Prorocentrum_lima.AAC.1
MSRPGEDADTTEEGEAVSNPFKSLFVHHILSSTQTSRQLDGFAAGNIEPKQQHGHDDDDESDPVEECLAFLRTAVEEK